MSMNRYAKMRDANEPKIIAALEAAGCVVEQLDVVDLLVLRGGKLFLLEVKDGAKVASRRALKPRQVVFHRRFPVSVVLSVDDALAAVGFVDVRRRLEANARAVNQQAAATVAAMGEA